MVDLSKRSMERFIPRQRCHKSDILFVHKDLFTFLLSYCNQPCEPDTFSFGEKEPKIF